MAEASSTVSFGHAIGFSQGLAAAVVPQRQGVSSDDAESFKSSGSFMNDGSFRDSFKAVSSRVNLIAQKTKVALRRYSRTMEKAKKQLGDEAAQAISVQRTSRLCFAPPLAISLL